MISDLEIVQTLMYFLFVGFKLSASRFKLDLESQISNAVSNFLDPSVCAAVALRSERNIVLVVM